MAKESQVRLEHRAHSGESFKALSALVGYSLLVSAVLFILDADGCFILISYTPLYISVFLYAIFATRRALKVLACHRARRDSVIAFMLLLAVGLLTLPWLETSARKRFYFAGNSLSAGMAVADAKRLMSSYDLFDKNEAAGYIRFTYRSSISSGDHFIVSFSPETHIIESVEYTTD